MVKNQTINQLFNFVKDKLFCKKTNLVYDHVVNGREKDFPTPAEILRGYPNPCGYTTGMEDGMINGATVLDACLLAFEKSGNKEAGAFAKKLVLGMLNCAKASKDAGFLPRAVCPTDNASHYPDSSRDQYTMFAFSLHRFFNSELCDDIIKKEIKSAVVNIAKRLERNVTKENGYDALTEDNRKSLATIMWGDSLDNHEYLRLPMIYLLAFEVSNDKRWLEKYKSIRDEAIQKSLPLINYWALYALSQMQASIRLCYDVEPDQEYKQKYLFLMNEVSNYVESKVDSVRERINALDNYNAPQICFRELLPVADKRWIDLGYQNAVRLIRADEKEFFTLQDGAQIGVILGLTPNRKPTKNAVDAFYNALSKIDLDVHERNLPVYFLDGYYRLEL